MLGCGEEWDSSQIFKRFLREYDFSFRPRALLSRSERRQSIDHLLLSLHAESHLIFGFAHEDAPSERRDQVNSSVVFFTYSKSDGISSQTGIFVTSNQGDQNKVACFDSIFAASTSVLDT